MNDSGSGRVRTVMILGAGVYQVPLIQRARAMNLRTVVLSRPGPYPGIPMADVFAPVDTTDIECVLRTAQEHDVAAVCTGGTDMSVPAMGAVADARKLPGPTQAMGETVSCKTRFRRFLADHHIHTPDFEACRSDEDVLQFRRRVGDVSIVMKPDDSSGSRGVTVLKAGADQAEWSRAYRHARSHSRSRLVCAETFIPGLEVGGDAFLAGGQIMHCSITKKHMAGVLVRGHSLPGNLSAADVERVKNELTRIAGGLGYRNGPLNFDVIVSEKQVTALELGLRTGGNGICECIRYSDGVDMFQWVLENALGLPLTRYPGRTVAPPVSSYVFGSACAGRLTRVPRFRELKVRMPELYEIALSRQIGDEVEPFTHNANLIGYLVFRCGASEYNEATERLARFLDIEVK